MRERWRPRATSPTAALQMVLQANDANGAGCSHGRPRIYRNVARRFGRGSGQKPFVRCLGVLSHLTLICPLNRGVWAALSGFLLFSMIQFRDGPFVRPHPAFWRIILGINLVYELAMVFLLFQDLGTAQQMMTVLDPNLGVPLPEKSYAEDCSFTFATVWVRPSASLSRACRRFLH